MVYVTRRFGLIASSDFCCNAQHKAPYVNAHFLFCCFFFLPKLMCYFDSLQTYDVFEPLKIKAFAIFTGGGGLVKDFRNAHAEEIVCARICEWYISKNSSICFK